MVLFGIRFVYGQPQLTDHQQRLASTRAAFAQWSRDKARRFAAARRKDPLARGRRVEEDHPPPARERRTVAVGPTSPTEEKEIVTVGPEDTVCIPPLYSDLPAWEGGKEIVTVGL